MRDARNRVMTVGSWQFSVDDRWERCAESEVERPRSSITERTGLTFPAKAHVLVRSSVDVSDTGRGVAVDAMRHVFEWFRLAQRGARGAEREAAIAAGHIYTIPQFRGVLDIPARARLPVRILLVLSRRA
jgi:hypothetical protein